MDIGAFIGELLEHQNQLIVPGFGTFHRKRVEGYYSKEQQQFYPPSLQLQFNPEQQDDDGKLVDLLMKEKQINVASARYFIEKYVAGLLSQLNTEPVPLGDIGIFSMRRNQLLFTPRKLNNNNELFYGLTPVKLRKNRAVTAEGVEKPRVQLPVTEKPSAFTAALLRGEPMPNAASVAAAEAEEAQQEEEIAEDKPKRISTWILALALIILVSGIALICAYKFSPQLFDRFRSSNEPPPISEKKQKRLVSDSIERAIQAQKDIGATPNIDTATLNKIEKPEQAVDTFAVVIGTFNTYYGANKEMARLRNDGLNVNIKKKPDNTKRYQLYVAEYYNLDSAKHHLNDYKYKLKDQTIFIETYLYKRQ